MNIIHLTIKFHNCDHNSVQPKGVMTSLFGWGYAPTPEVFPSCPIWKQSFQHIRFFWTKNDLLSLLWPSFVASVSCFWQVGWSKSKVALENGFLNYQTSYMHTIFQKLLSFCPSTMEIRSVCKFMDWFSEQSTILLIF